MMSTLKKYLILTPLRQSQLICLLSIILPPVCLMISAISTYVTIGVFVVMFIFLIFLRKYLLDNNIRDKDRTKSYFFFLWLLSSIIFLVFVFHMFVVSLLEILPEENIVLVIFATFSIGCLYNAKQKSPSVNQIANYTSDVESLSDDKQSVSSNSSIDYCSTCQANIPNGYSHCVWLNCCIGSDNNRLFYCGILFGIAAFSYGSNLTLTTVCHPFILYKNFLLPDDCSEVYYQYDISLCFVCGMYSFIIACFMLLYIIKEILVYFAYLTGFNIKCLYTRYIKHLHSYVFSLVENDIN